MKREGRSKQTPAAGEHQDDTSLGDIARHWRASRMIEAREPLPSRAPAPRHKRD